MAQDKSSHCNCLPALWLHRSVRVPLRHIKIGYYRLLAVNSDEIMSESVEVEGSLENSATRCLSATAT
jgi:hypothetical protein